MRILVLDNYDSFTYNLVYLLKEAGAEAEVFRNDKITVADAGEYDKILLSPGPGIPSEAGIMQELIKTLAPRKSILGICLGEQGIAEAFGASLENMKDVLHGVSEEVIVTDPTEKLFAGLPERFLAGRYHSWTVVPSSIPETLRITAVDAEGRVMGIAHKQFDVKGLQFHPESVLTEHGKEIITNWLRE